MFDSVCAILPASTIKPVVCLAPQVLKAIAKLKSDLKTDKVLIISYFVNYEKPEKHQQTYRQHQQLSAKYSFSKEVIIKDSNGLHLAALFLGRQLPDGSLIYAKIENTKYTKGDRGIVFGRIIHKSGVKPKKQ